MKNVNYQQTEYSITPQLYQIVLVAHIQLHELLVDLVIFYCHENEPVKIIIMIIIELHTILHQSTDFEVLFS